MAVQKYFIHLTYKGTNYQGWQRQANGLGVQEVVEEKLSRIFKQKIVLHACGRTDAGVHASQFFCHTRINGNWGFDAVFRMNKLLPKDISIIEFIPVAATANAQLDVHARTYDYFFHVEDNPFLSELSTLYKVSPINIEEMRKAAHLIQYYTDFRSFCKQPDIHPSTICQISDSSLAFNDSRTQFRFRITGNRFLKAMVRMLVGHLIKIGEGKITLIEFEALFKSPQLSKKPMFAYPQGLYLSKVLYPYLERAIKNPFLFKN